MKYFLVLALSLITICTSSEPLLAASTYGRDGYNTCDYSRDCPTIDTEETSPPPVPNTPETPKTDNTSIVVIDCDLFRSLLQPRNARNDVVVVVVGGGDARTHDNTLRCKTVQKRHVHLWKNAYTKRQTFA